MCAFSTVRLAQFVGLAALVALSGCDETEKQDESKAPVIRPVKTITIAAGDSSRQFSYPAVVSASDEVELSFRVSGKLTELLVRAGDRVQQGQAIAKLDTRDFQAEITRLQTQLAQAQAQMTALTSGARSEDLASLRAGLNAAKAQFHAAQAQARRTATLYRKGISARAALDKDMAALRVADAEVKAQQQELAKGQSGARVEDVSAQEAAMAGIRSQIASAQDTLNDTVLRAPFAGVIADRKVENFANIQAKEAIATLQSEAGLELTFDVPGPDVTILARDPDPDGRAVLDGVPNREFETELVEFSSQPDPATQTYRGRVSIERPADVTILPGMTGRLVVTVGGDGTSALAVPASALAAHPDGAAFVWVVSRENTVEKRDVTLGEASGDGVAVQSGLTTGEVVVTAGVSQLQEGMAVRPVSRVGE